MCSSALILEHVILKTIGQSLALSLNKIKHEDKTLLGLYLSALPNKLFRAATAQIVTFLELQMFRIILLSNACIIP